LDRLAGCLSRKGDWETRGRGAVTTELLSVSSLFAAGSGSVTSML